MAILGSSDNQTQQLNNVIASLENVNASINNVYKVQAQLLSIMQGSSTSDQKAFASIKDTMDRQTAAINRYFSQNFGGRNTSDVASAQVSSTAKLISSQNGTNNEDVNAEVVEVAKAIRESTQKLVEASKNATTSNETVLKLIGVMEKQTTNMEAIGKIVKDIKEGKISTAEEFFKRSGTTVDKDREQQLSPIITKMLEDVKNIQSGDQKTNVDEREKQSDFDKLEEDSNQAIIQIRDMMIEDQNEKKKKELSYKRKTPSDENGKNTEKGIADSSGNGGGGPNIIPVPGFGKNLLKKFAGRAFNFAAAATSITSTIAAVFEAMKVSDQMGETLTDLGNTTRDTFGNRHYMERGAIDDDYEKMKQAFISAIDGDKDAPDWAKDIVKRSGLKILAGQHGVRSEMFDKWIETYYKSLSTLKKVDPKSPLFNIVANRIVQHSLTPTNRMYDKFYYDKAVAESESYYQSIAHNPYTWIGLGSNFLTHGPLAKVAAGVNIVAHSIGLMAQDNKLGMGLMFDSKYQNEDYTSKILESTGKTIEQLNADMSKIPSSDTKSRLMITTIKMMIEIFRKTIDDRGITVDTSPMTKGAIFVAAGGGSLHQTAAVANAGKEHFRIVKYKEDLAKEVYELIMEYVDRYMECTTIDECYKVSDDYYHRCQRLCRFKMLNMVSDLEKYQEEHTLGVKKHQIESYRTSLHGRIGSFTQIARNAIADEAKQFFRVGDRTYAYNTMSGNFFRVTDRGEYQLIEPTEVEDFAARNGVRGNIDEGRFTDVSFRRYVLDNRDNRGWNGNTTIIMNMGTEGTMLQNNELSPVGRKGQ